MMLVVQNSMVKSQPVEDLHCFHQIRVCIYIYTVYNHKMVTKKWFINVYEIGYWGYTAVYT